MSTRALIEIELDRMQPQELQKLSRYCKSLERRSSKTLRRCWQRNRP